MNDTLMEQKKALSRLWNLFSALFCQPDTEIHGNKEIYIEFARCINIVDKKLTKEAETLWEHYFTAGHQSILIEYTRLFIGPFKTIAPPYSSVYLGNDGTLFGAETQQVLDYYLKSGVEFNFSTNDLPDHIAVELEFLHYLSAHEIITIEKGDVQIAANYADLQKIFLDNHLKKWVPEFCKRINSDTNEPFYRSLATLFINLIQKS